jgi:hypothetical protein
MAPLHQLQGTITPNGLHFERHHSGVPDIDPAQPELLIHGLVRRPLKFSVAALLRYPTVSRAPFPQRHHRPGDAAGRKNAPSGENAEPRRLC